LARRLKKKERDTGTGVKKEGNDDKVGGKAHSRNGLIGCAAIGGGRARKES